MTFKKIGIVLFLIFSLIPINKVFAQASNAGFIPGNIWYSADTFEEGDTVKIYTVVFNPDARELSGTIVFFDNNVFFAKKNFVANAKSVRDVSIDWTATAGSHSIFGKIENAKFLISSGKYEEVYLAENETSKSVRTVAKKIVVPTVANNTTGVTNNIINSIIDTASSAGSNSIKNAGETIVNNTPDFISEPIIATADAVETFRQNTATTLKNKQAEVQKEVDKLNKESSSDSKKTSQTMTADDFMKPLKFTELFALALFSNIFDNKFIFYTLLFLFVFLLLYYVVRRIRTKK